MKNTSTVVHEAYSFVCLGCGHGWEREYEIHHATDLRGQQVCHYYADGKRVPSPFSRPRCENCDGERLRILRAGRVASATTPSSPETSRTTQTAPTGGSGASAAASGQTAPAAAGPRHWYSALTRR